MATAIGIPGQNAPRRQRTRWLAVALGMLLGLSATTGNVAAEDTLPGTISVSKSEFIEICQDTGGNAIEQSDGSVTCFYPDGSWSNCEFVTMTCQDSPAVGRPDPGTIVPPGSGDLLDPGSDTGAGIAPTSDDDEGAAKPTMKRKHEKHKGGKHRKGGSRGKGRGK